MFLVVFAHLYGFDSQERLYIYAFHMPFFFFVSGMLHKNMPVLKGLIRNTRLLIIPTASFLLITYIIARLFYGWHLYAYFKTCHEGAIDGWGFPLNVPIWFLIALFYVKVLTDIYLWNRIVGLVLFGSCFYLSSVYFNPYFVCSAMMAFPIYVLGMKSREITLRLSFVPWVKWFFPFFFIISICLTLINGKVSMIAHNFGKASAPYNIILFYINGIIGSIGLLCLSYFIKKPYKIITIVATSLISILGLQQLFINVYDDYVGKKSYLYTIPVTIVIIALCCIFHRIIDRCCPMMLGKSIQPTLKRALDRVYEIVCPHLPLQRKIVFDNFGGRGMGDDPKYIALYIKEHYPDIKLIWLLSDMNTPMPDGITPVYIYSRKARYHLYTAKIWVDNIKNFKKTPKRKGQFYLQTWHGGIVGLKLAEAQIENLLPQEYVKAAKFDASITDLMYTDNDFVKEIFEKGYWYHGKVMKCDLPRISVLLNLADSLRNKVFSYYNLSQTKKVLLYAPTYRSVHDVSLFIWDYEKVLDLLSERFGGEFVMLLRLHPNFAQLSEQIKYSERVISASGYPDMQELLAASDVLISDYSSTTFDFAAMYRPIFLYGPDVETFSRNERGLLFDMYSLPFKMNKSEVELQTTIMDYDHKRHCEAIDTFFHYIGFKDSGNGCKQLTDILMQYI